MMREGDVEMKREGCQKEMKREREKGARRRSKDGERKKDARRRCRDGEREKDTRRRCRDKERHERMCITWREKRHTRSLKAYVIEIADTVQRWTKRGKSK